MSSLDLMTRCQGALVGLAVGDALGTTVEFEPRGSFSPVLNMVGGGPFMLEPGEWTDDTSMALCLADSLASCNGFDAHDQMMRYYKWMTEGYLSSNGVCFDIGITVREALIRFRDGGPTFSGVDDPHSAGNGCIMRLAPVPIYYFPDLEKTIQYSIDSSRTTHGAAECLEACALLAEILYRCFSGWEITDALRKPFNYQYMTPNIKAIAGADYLDLAEARIRSSGYVVDCLRASLWCLAGTDSFSSAVLRAVNLGDDADTTGAVTGQIAGAYYGVNDIPEGWLNKLAMKDFIYELVAGLRR